MECGFFLLGVAWSGFVERVLWGCWLFLLVLCPLVRVLVGESQPSALWGCSSLKRRDQAATRVRAWTSPSNMLSSKKFITHAVV